MFKTLIGVLLLLLPFLFSMNYKKQGFIKILSLQIVFILILGIMTQVLHIFYYNVILIAHILFNGYLYYRFKGIKKLKFEWVMILLIFIAVLHLYHVHYDYNGKYSTIGSQAYQDANQMQYQYPYYADEWYSIAFIKYSIANHGLPLNNPLMENEAFINLEFPFHTFLSELVLMLDVDPLNDYTKLSLIFGILIVLIIYMYLRQNKIDNISASLSALGVLYITNSANLPGLWTLIPIILGTMCFLLSLFEDKYYLMMIVSLIFYPPLIVFYSVLIAYRLMKNMNFKILLPIVISGIVISIGFFFVKSNLEFFNYISSKLLFTTPVTQCIQQFSIINIIPIVIVLVSLLGLIPTYKRRPELIYLIILGSLLWIFYSFTVNRFIIEYERVIFVTSVLIVMVSGFGLSRIFKFFSHIKGIETISRKLTIFQIGFLIFLLLLSFNYTNDSRWEKLVCLDDGKIFKPAAPANQYLQFDDLVIFNKLNGQTLRFLSVPWKGTVIGVATDNYPIATKPGTITNHIGLYQQFMESDCEKRKELITLHHVVYLYTPMLYCDYLVEIDRSSEGLVLYKIKG